MNRSGTLNNDIIGILYVGVLEQKYVDIRTQTVLVFLVITLGGALVAVALSYFISRNISGAIRRVGVCLGANHARQSGSSGQGHVTR